MHELINLLKRRWLESYGGSKRLKKKYIQNRSKAFPTVVVAFLGSIT